VPSPAPLPAAKSPDLVVNYGELTTPGSLRRRSLLYLLPGYVWVALFLILPLVLLVLASFATRGESGEVLWQFTWENYQRLAGYSFLGWSADYLLTLGRSIVVGLVTTLLCALLSYPLTFFIATRPKRTRYIWLTLVIIPFWTNLVIRTYAWQLVLAPELPLARLAAFLRLVEPGQALYPSAFAIYLGMLTTFLPFFALPLYASVERMNWALVEAANDLYASRWRVFRHAILPQTFSGLSVGIILTFIPAMGMFVVPDLLGGSKYLLVGNLVQQQFSGSRDWPFGATVSLALMFLTLLALLIFNRQIRRLGES
jgi:spermidine/putrescine transport system permease protein